MNDSRLEALETYFRLMFMNGAPHVYRTACESRIFEAMAAGPATTADIARSCGTHAGSTELVLGALAALGLVRKVGGAYESTPVTRYLSGPYRDLGDSYWRHLPKWLVTGEPLIPLENAALGEAFYAAQASALAWMVGPAAEAAAEILGARPARDIVDVGAGSAVWSLALARRHPEIRVTAIDRPAVLEVARAAAAKAGLSDRLTLLPGDLATISWPEGRFDLAILANVAHLLTPEGNVGLLRRIRAALKPGGAVAVIDVVPGTPGGDLPVALYALGLALRTNSGRTYGRAELDRILSEAGFAAGNWTALDVVPHTLGMVVAAREA